MKNTLRTLGMATVMVAGLALVACGGDDFNNNTPDVTAEVPASASASVGGFIDYLMKLVVSSADMLEPVNISAVTAPTDDTVEPTVLP